MEGNLAPSDAPPLVPVAERDRWLAADPLGETATAPAGGMAALDGERYRPAPEAFGADGLAMLPRSIQWHFVRAEELRLGVHAEAGWLWTSVSVPLSLRVGEGAWLTGAPYFGVRANGSVRLPIGLSLRVGSRARLHLESSVAAVPEEGKERPPVMWGGGATFRR